MTVLTFWSLVILGMAAFGLAETIVKQQIRRRADRRFVARVRRLTR